VDKQCCLAGRLSAKLSGRHPTHRCPSSAQRRGFTRLLDRLEPGDVLVVTKLDRLGRNVTDVGSTVAKLPNLGYGSIASHWAGLI
jgi:DNA invertase Pin-like site-specific DNA recombinase